MELSDRYQPDQVEKRIYEWWNSKGYFKAQDKSTKPPFSIILPPPNVTGQLHIGHALNHTVQDVLIRWKRMSGFNTLWLPGTDHAGIATQSVVERELKKNEGKSRQDLGREKFVERVWEWKHQYGNRIVEQMRSLGDSCDWDRLTFTLDENVSRAVRKVFVSLYEKQQIYRGKRLINWSPALESAISDLEVEYKEIRGSLYHIRYPLPNGQEGVVVATTRPETLLGDVAVAVHPDDERYKILIGKEVMLPLSKRLIRVIADEAVDKEFGSGVVKITPAHDFNDYQMGLRHKLPMINILNKDGTLNDEGLAYKGLKVQEARKRVLADLEAQGFLVKTEPHTHQVGHCSRTGCVVEPFLSEQWFVKVGPMATQAKRVVESGTLVFEPESWTKTYLNWMNNIQDWCISRQLWWGHRIPAWHCSKCGKTTVALEDPKVCAECGYDKIEQDNDVLDTWFSSALWPFSTLGWPDETEAQKTFYPTTVLVTAFDIIFFWVARMVMMGLEFKKDVPFRTVYIHGVIRDAEGKKMSKSAGNSQDPLELISEYGADALRFTLLAQIAGGRDLKFSIQRLEGYRNFMNKIWNATRFALRNLGDFKAPAEGDKALPNKVDLSDADKWILFKLGEVEAAVDQAMENLRFSDAANLLYAFVWNSFCDWYIELTKPVFLGNNAQEKAATQLVMAQVLNRIARLLHPFIPFVTEEIYQNLPIHREAAIIDDYPTVKKDAALLALGSAEVAAEMDLVQEVITAIRNIRGENRIKPGQMISAKLNPADEHAQKVLGKNRTSIMTLAKVENLEIGPVTSFSKCAVQPVISSAFKVDVVVPLAGLVDIDEEVKRIQKGIEKLEKEQQGLARRLEDSSFVKNAPEEILTAAKQQLVDNRNQTATMRLQLSRLQE